MTTWVLDVHLTDTHQRDALIRDARAGLTAPAKSLPAKYFYDARGSELFEEITELPEYYLTRAEHAILTAQAGAIVSAAGLPDTLIELGSGMSTKTRLLLDSLQASGQLRRYVPVDVSRSALDQAVAALGAEYPGLALNGVVADFESQLSALPADGQRLVAFLGSTIGNFDAAQRARLFASLRLQLSPGDSFLLGTDLVKDPGRLVAAYDDSAGVTAQFNRNVLAVLNTYLGADFDLDRFEHVATWNVEAEWMEMRLRATEDMRVRLADLGLEINFERGEEIRTEISAKFRRNGLEVELAAAGFELGSWWTDPAGDFALSLAFPR
jgi:L-histidine Nalpha-methyltransferase